ncbi:MAG: hypothetical protein ACXVYM_08895 [Gaiellaceae bacterium]
MARSRLLALALGLGLLLASQTVGASGSAAAPSAVAGTGAVPARPARTVKLIFVHHSTGENWLADDNGRLGLALEANNYFVSDTNYGWGPDGIGDRTDIGDWWTWFRGPRSKAYLSALYAEDGQHSSYTRMAADPDPGRENQIIVFKSCFPNSQISGRPGDRPAAGANPLRGQAADSPAMTVANVKGIYDDLLRYFARHRDKLFVLVVSPPLRREDTDASHAANARAVADWLVGKWLAGYRYGNVAVLDFFNVLSSNGGSSDRSDLGSRSGNHHRWRNGGVQHLQTVHSNVSAYPSEDSHPSRAGNLKATAELVPLLNLAYRRWAAHES